MQPQVWQSDATQKRMRAHIRRIAKDVTSHTMYVKSTHWSTDEMVLEYPGRCRFDMNQERLRLLRTLLMIPQFWPDLSRYLVFSSEVGLQLAGRGWNVVATYLGTGIVQGKYGPYRGDNCYYLAINSATGPAILSPFCPDYSGGCWEENWDGSITAFPPDAYSWPALLGMESALRLALSPIGGYKPNPGIPWLLKLSCMDMYRHAQYRLDPANPTEQLKQQACHSEAVAALYATFMWTCPLVLSAG